MANIEQHNNIPIHVAIVPDGNRRWAKNQGMKPWEGHEKGAQRIEEITREAFNLGVKYLTFWGSSVDNLTKRPMEEKLALLKIYEKYFSKLIESKDIFENQTRIQIFGRWQEQFPAKLKNLLEKGIEKTKNHAKLFLTFLLAYNGDDEIIQAIEKISNKAAAAKEKFKMNAETLKENLITGSLPDVDLLIRTGVENDPHNSAGFMMWHTKNSQYYFSEKLMPEFSAEEFRRAIEDFSNRSRRFGK